MSKSDVTKISYGRPLLKSLVGNANKLGNNLSFYMNEDGKYVIKDGHENYRPPTAIAACHFVMGVISASRTILK
jgi:hypothetical protein